MILIITHKKDFTADYIIQKLNERNIAYRRFNCEDILESDTTISLGDSTSFSIGGQNEFDTVWFRRTMLPDLDSISREEAIYVLGETEAYLHNLFSIIDAKWLSIPKNIYYAENKLLQLKTARNLGFKIPATLVTADRNKVVEFYHIHKNIIVKPISNTRIQNDQETSFIFTSSISNSHIDNISQFDITPCLFQEQVEKCVEIRVTVVGEQIFAAQVKSQEDPDTKTDWRRKRLKFDVFELPPSISDKCVNLVKQFGLLFGAIDLILSPDGTYTFLEINPNGQWVWIETNTGLRISEAIINELTSN